MTNMFPEPSKPTHALNHENCQVPPLDGDQPSIAIRASEAETLRWRKHPALYKSVLSLGVISQKAAVSLCVCNTGAQLVESQSKAISPGTSLRPQQATRWAVKSFKQLLSAAL